MEYSAFEEATVPICSFVLKNGKETQKGLYFRLSDFKGGMEVQKQKVLEALENKNCGYFYETQPNNFSKIPGSPMAYWLAQQVYDVFATSKVFIKNKAYGEGKNVTTNNAKYILFVWEVEAQKVGAFNYKWLPCAMGGDYRKWYGNIVNVIDWSKEAQTFYKKNPAGRIIREEFWNLSGVTWGKISSGSPSFRLLMNNQMYQETAVLQHDMSDTLQVLAILNSKPAQYFLKFLAPTINFQLQDICAIPIPEDISYQNNEIHKLSNTCVSCSKEDWNSYETSWDFKKHPLVALARKSTYKENRVSSYRIEDAFFWWNNECDTRFAHLRENEEKLNSIFIDIYGLQDELTPEVEDKEISVRKADLQRDIRSLLSYAVGCMFGRYSLDVDGLAYAGGEWDNSKYTTFLPDQDNVIPITDEEYLEDDIVGLLCAWLKKVYGADTLEENLDFIASALVNKGNSSREIIRNYFLNDFFKDHIKIYQKCPIYWLFDSGKQNGFKALIYLHRYTPDTIGNLRIDYLHRMQRIYESEMNRMQDMIDNSTNTREVGAATKRKEKLAKQLKECREYDEKIGHLALSRIELDLDDGVKVNYEKVQTASDGKKYQVLVKI
jgi:hypothetical protein